MDVAPVVPKAIIIRDLTVKLPTQSAHLKRGEVYQWKRFNIGDTEAKLTDDAHVMFYAVAHINECYIMATAPPHYSKMYGCFVQQAKAKVAAKNKKRFDELEGACVVCNYDFECVYDN